MTALAAFLAVALAAGPSDAPRRASGLDPSNAARARAGLLPRKAARTRVEVRRLRTVSAPAPTYLGAPEDPPPDGVAVADGAAPDEAREDAAAPDASAPAVETTDDGWIVERRGDVHAAAPDSGPAPDAAVRVASRGPVQTIRLREAPPAPAMPVEVAATVTPTVLPPEEVGAVRAALLGVTTEVTLRLRFDP